MSLYGGEGRIVGIVAGILLLMLINNALIVLNVSPFFQQVALGLVLGVAIVADRIRAGSRGHARPRGSPSSARKAARPRETPPARSRPPDRGSRRVGAAGRPATPDQPPLPGWTTLTESCFTDVDEQAFVL